MRPDMVLHIREFAELLVADLALHLLVMATSRGVDNLHRPPKLLLLLNCLAPDL